MPPTSRRQSLDSGRVRLSRDGGGEGAPIPRKLFERGGEGVDQPFELRRRHRRAGQHSRDRSGLYGRSQGRDIALQQMQGLLQGNFFGTETLLRDVAQRSVEGRDI